MDTRSVEDATARLNAVGAAERGGRRFGRQFARYGL